MVKCSECDKVFELIWQREYEGEQVEYCPFCGREVPADAELIPVDE